MRTRVLRVSAWLLWALSVTAIITAEVLSRRYPFFSILEESHALSNLVWSASWLGFGLVGALIVSQRATNRVGWILCGITFGIALAMLGSPYGRAASQGVSLPLAGLATWLAAWVFQPALGLVLGLLLLFPTGRLATVRQRALAWTLVAAVGINTLLAMVMPGPVEGDAPPNNPLGIEAWGRQLEAVEQLVTMIIGGIGVAVLLDLVYRAWKSRGVERQQFKWLVLAAASFPILLFLAMALEAAVVGQRGFDPVVVVFFLCGNGIAAAIGVAVSRHGLYEMNRVVSRSVGYALLTAVLAAIYAAAVSVLSVVTAPVAGKSPVAVAAATLLAAGAFGPARRRIQGAVDRSFNRARYDAGQTVESYRQRLREEVDLDALTADLLATVATSMQPAGTSLWLRGPK